jgi:thymidine kinase
MSKNDFTEIATNNDPRATVGELFVYGLLKRHLPNDCAVYFQPHVHSKQRADILVLRKGCGAALLEIKDWIPELYKSEEHDGNIIFKVASTGSILRHPADQVEAYKSSMYETCSLVIDTLFNPKLYSVINTFVIYTNYLGPAEQRRYTKIISRKVLLDNLNNLCSLFGIDNSNSIYSDSIHRRLLLQVNRRVLPLQPAVALKQGKRQQSALALPDNNRRKIMGPAGSGKTTIALAACKSWASDGNSVLILVYTRTMRNHYRYLLDHLDCEFDRTKIDVMTFSKWASDVALHVIDFETVNDLRRYEELSNSIESKEQAESDSTHNQEIATLISGIESISNSMKYDCLIIDEAQDFAKEWMVIAERLAKVKDGKYLLLADEVQNVFGRAKDEDGKVNTNISGDWFRLDKVYRNQGKIFRYCNEYRKLISSKDNQPTHTDVLQYDCEEIEYSIERDNSTNSAMELFRNMQKKSPDDTIAIIANKRQTLTDISDILSKEYVLNRMVETTEERLKILRVSHDTVLKRLFARMKKDIDKEHTRILIDSVHRLEASAADNYAVYERWRKSRSLPDKTVVGEANYLVFQQYKSSMQLLDMNLKSHFHSTAGRLILCTVHSLKGQQVDHVIYIHDNTNEVNNELVYTALTRAVKSLYVIDAMDDELLRTAYNNAMIPS